MVCGRG
ncbi:UNVERIFIED_CONTAM: hypothetical protein GTU68_031766 [Idotea baltica]|nr:hypothetical protein [Idotea baltica]